MSDMIKGRDLLDALGEIGAPATLPEILKVFNAQYPSMPVNDLKLNLKRALLAGVRFGYLQKEGEYFYSTVGTEEAFLELLKSSEELETVSEEPSTSAKANKAVSVSKDKNCESYKTKKDKHVSPCTNPNCRGNHTDMEDDDDGYDDEDDELFFAALKEKIDDEDDIDDDANNDDHVSDALIDLETKIKVKEDGKLFVDESEIKSGVYYATETGLKKFIKAVNTNQWKADMATALSSSVEVPKPGVSKSNRNTGAQKRKIDQKRKAPAKKRSRRSRSVPDDDYDRLISDDEDTVEVVDSEDDFSFKPCCSNCCLRRKPRRSRCRRKRSRSRSCRPKRRRSRSRRRSCSRRRKRKIC